ncbi:FAD-binding protein [Rhodococcus sp. H29-C3]|uniref:FAD-binding protein n=1 Tax=Rhodococcus sp. H29-C3 TaxID=3046307 RepID=UPI0024B9F6B7|nr:FAD-binding protein [Rhodococcus sp. H29-C3]MDJ0360001.1 FAD-binding protein [Rhodococcus sp. H29-C3]
MATSVLVIGSGGSGKRPMRRLARIDQTLMELQMLDITTDPMEIAPTAHYSMGGVWVRPDDHSTDVTGLYAIGEAQLRSETAVSEARAEVDTLLAADGRENVRALQ